MHILSQFYLLRAAGSRWLVGSIPYCTVRKASEPTEICAGKRYTSLGELMPAT